MSNVPAGEMGSYPNYAELCKEWYTDPQWKRIPVFPGMDGERLELSALSTTVEIESIEHFAYGKKTFQTLRDYKELFHN